MINDFRSFADRRKAMGGRILDIRVSQTAGARVKLKRLYPSI